MPLKTDPDTLRIPAFMRRRSLSARNKKPLVLTALDRKKELSSPLRLVGRGKLQRRSIRSRVKPGMTNTQPLFAPPLLDMQEIASPRREVVARNDKSIGTITHYYNKIKVGVIKLKNTLSVGDTISYETEDGETTEQIIQSMEIDRQPVFKAGKGKEIGLKLKKIPRIGTTCHCEER